MKKILIVDDEESIREGFSALLAAEGYSTFTAENGLAAIAIAGAEKPDIIICDVMMPGTTGYDVLKALRQDPARAGIPFIFLTALGDRAYVRQGMELGADDYLTKPCTREELVNAVSARLARQASSNLGLTTKLKETEKQLDHASGHDETTDLLNRSRFLKELDEMLTEAGRKGNPVYCLTVGFRRLSFYRETLGDPFAIELLKAGSNRISSLLPEGLFMLSRSGENQITAAISAIKPKEIAQLAQNILLSFANPFNLQGQHAFPVCCIGISVFPDHGSNSNALLTNSERAMQLSDKTEQTGFLFYSDKKPHPSLDLVELEKDLHHAWERDEMNLHYQAQVDVRTGRITGAESLIRWHHPQRGNVSPDAFIPIAEEAGFMIPLGHWILKNACAQAKRFQEFTSMPFRIAVNLSAIQFNQGTFPEVVTQILKDTGLHPSNLELELTETTISRNPIVAHEVLCKLKDQGIHIALDDFGMGYSSVNYLRDYPVDTLKIDRSLVHPYSPGGKNSQITAGLIQMGRGLNLNVVAEGVETVDELNFLAHHGCHQIQGYLCGRPVPAPDFCEILKKGTPLL